MRVTRCLHTGPKLFLKIVVFVVCQVLLFVAVERLIAHVSRDSQCYQKRQVNGPDDVVWLSRNDVDTGQGPLKILRENGHVNSIASLEINKLTTEQLLLTIHSYLDNADVLCQRKIRMGRIGDGGWEVCDDPDVRPRDPCIIYSFGINDDFSFDDDAARLYGCHVFSFDPSMTHSDFDYNRSSNVHFYRIGLSGTTHINNKQWPLYTLTDIRTKLGHHNSTINVIKMDIEGSEWGALPQMLRHGELQNVRQFYVEFHLNKDTRGYLLPRMKAVQALARAGFRKFYVHKNRITKTVIQGFPVLRTRCYEVHYLKR